MTKSAVRHSDITVLRVVSMLMIVLCHIVRYYTFIPGHSILAQILDVGVFTFLLISGYLYGLKRRRKFGTFILSRALRIGVPVILTLVIDVLALWFFFDERYSFATILCYLFNLQGLALVAWDLFNSCFVQIQNLGPLWFASVIMLCYCILPLFEFLREKLEI